VGSIPPEIGGNEMKKMKTIGVLALVFVGMVFSATMISAYRGDYSVEGPNCDEARHEVMEDAFESLDYDAWYALMTADGRHPRVVDVVTEENFATFIQAHEAGEAGDTETAAELRAELGLNNGNGPRDGSGYARGMGQGKGQGMQRNNRENTDHEHSGLGRGRRRV